MTMQFQVGETVTFADRGGETKRRRIFVYGGTEQFRPHGNYSMAAIITADKEGAPVIRAGIRGVIGRHLGW